MDTVTLIGSFALTGVIVSAIVEFTKGFLDKAGHRTAYTVAIAFVGGLVIYFFHLVPTNFVDTLVGVLGAANTAYLVVVRYLPLAAPSAPQQ